MVTQRESHGLSYALAALGILTSLSLGIATLMYGVSSPSDPDVQGPSVSLEETEPTKGSDTPNDAQQPFDPRQAQLVSALDERLYATVAQIEPGTSPHDVTIPGGFPTVVLPARPSPYDLSTLTSTGAVTKQSDGTLLMQKSVLVGAGAQLQLSAPGSTLRMTSGPQGFATLIAFKGSMVLQGNEGSPLSITSWDPTKSAADAEPSDGRAFIRTVGGRMDLRAVNATNLGFWSGRTGGIAWTGSAAEAATGSARGVNVTGNHYGFFSDRTKGLLINGGDVKQSAMDGIAVNRDSTGTELWKVSSSQNGRNGIAVARGAHSISIREVVTTGNSRNGVFLDGTPPAQGPNAGGGTTAHAAGFTVDSSKVQGNAEHGILINGADKAELIRNTVSANKDGIIVRGVTQGTTLRENRISSPGGFAVAVREGSKDALVDKNIISDALTAVQVENAITKISGNEISGMTMHAVSIIGNCNGSSVVDNRWVGRGPSDIDMTRIGGGSLVEDAGNDKAGWVVDKDNAKYLASFIRNHPLVLLWFLILVLPLAGRLYIKRGRTQPGQQHPYRPVAAVASVPSAPASPSASSSVARTPGGGVRPARSAARPPSSSSGSARRSTPGTAPARDARPGRDAMPVRQPGRSRPGGKPSVPPASRNGAAGRSGSEPPAGKQPGPPVKPVSWSGQGPRQPGESSRPGQRGGGAPRQSRPSSTPGAPGKSGAPGTPGTPGAPGKPGGPAKPGTPSKPGAPGGQAPQRSGKPQRPGNPEPPGKQGGPGPRQPNGQQGGPANPSGRGKPGGPSQQQPGSGQPGSGQQPGPGQGQRPGGQNQQGPNNKRPPQGGARTTVVSPK